MVKTITPALQMTGYATSAPGSGYGSISTTGTSYTAPNVVWQDISSNATYCSASSALNTTA